jgi:hypothetical protein
MKHANGSRYPDSKLEVATNALLDQKRAAFLSPFDRLLADDDRIDQIAAARNAKVGAKVDGGTVWASRRPQ